MVNADGSGQRDLTRPTADEVGFGPGRRTASTWLSDEGRRKPATSGSSIATARGSLPPPASRPSTTCTPGAHGREEARAAAASCCCCSHLRVRRRPRRQRVALNQLQLGDTTADASTEPKLVYDGKVPVAPDRELAAQCWGSGSPTILLEAGGTRSNIGEWSTRFVMNLAADNTVCLYSRAGGEGSTPPPDDMLTYDIVVGDAFTLLDWLRDEYRVSGPYVFVGWSFGGHVALAEALARPDETAGIVILDNDPPATADFDDLHRIGADGGRVPGGIPGDLEQQLGADIHAQIHPLPDLPAAIVSAMIFPDCRLEPGESTVSYNLNGADVIAPDCQELATRVADVHAEGWIEVLPQLTQTRVQASHDELVNQAGFTIVEIIQEWWREPRPLTEAIATSPMMCL